MGIWNEIQEQLKQLDELINESRRIEQLYKPQNKTENDRITNS